MIIRAATNSNDLVFRYLPMRNGKYLVNAYVENSMPISGKLAKIAAISDSLKVTATGYTTKTVKITSYDTTVDITLDSIGTCPHTTLQGNNILTIGDSWIQMPGSQVTHLLDKMIAAGSMAAGAKADRREVSGSTLSSIIGQFTSKSNANAKILIMDGGGIDLFSAPLNPTSSQVTAVVNKFKDFLQTVKDDGNIEHIIYSLYPVIPTTPNLNGNMKAGFTEACQNSPVDCHLVDLEPLFKGQHFAADRTHANETGAQIIADAWWKCMKENCIGQ